jgi:hypothetical protein
LEYRKIFRKMIQFSSQIVRTGRRIIYRLLGWNAWSPAFFRLWYALRP